MLRRFLIGKHRLPLKRVTGKTQKVHPANRFSPVLGEKKNKDRVATEGTFAPVAATWLRSKAMPFLDGDEFAKRTRDWKTLP